jgi:hypothetical protein
MQLAMLGVKIATRFKLYKYMFRITSLPLIAAFTSLKVLPESTSVLDAQTQAFKANYRYAPQITLKADVLDIIYGIQNNCACVRDAEIAFLPANQAQPSTDGKIQVDACRRIHGIVSFEYHPLFYKGEQVFHCNPTKYKKMINFFCYSRFATSNIERVRMVNSKSCIDQACPKGYIKVHRQRVSRMSSILDNILLEVRTYIASFFSYEELFMFWVKYVQCCQDIHLYYYLFAPQKVFRCYNLYRSIEDEK